MRLPTGDRSLLSATLCVLHRRTEVATGDPCRRHSIAFRSLGGAQLREATPYGQAPKYLIRDNDCKFGSCFARVAARQRHQGTQNAVSCPTSQCDLRALHEERKTRMPRSPVDLSGETAPTACSMPMWRTSTRHDRIKGSGNRSLNRADQLFPLIKQASR